MIAAAAKRIAYFITPHGYGHAARASAVMSAIHEQQPEIVFEIFTRVPVWFFNMSLQQGFHYHELLTDIGLIQATSMEEDLPETIRQLGQMLPYPPEKIKALAAQVLALGCEIVLCDVAPMGIAVAKEAGLPSVLIENFTWDWIYEGYLDQEPGFAPYNQILKRIFASADFHIRTEPACETDSPADMLTNVVSRKPRTSREEIRRQLGVSQEVPMVMITMGGIVTSYPFLDQLEQTQDIRFLIPGGSHQHQLRGSLVMIPHHSNYYHPDLVAASDVMIGKLGYSTLAEAYSLDMPYAFIPRERFRESPPMGRFAREEMGAVEVSEERFFDGAWLDLLPSLIARPRVEQTRRNGADQIAEQVLRMIKT